MTTTDTIQMILDVLNDEARIDRYLHVNDAGTYYVTTDADGGVYLPACYDVEATEEDAEGYINQLPATMTPTITNLLATADAAARSIEKAAAEEGTAYAAAQTFYGVEVEALIGDDWVRVRDLEDGAEVEAVRLFDCDGERGAACRTVEQVEAERVKWVRMLEQATNDDAE